jgi:putative MATE family efflux protein
MHRVCAAIGQHKYGGERKHSQFLMECAVACVRFVFHAEHRFAGAADDTIGMASTYFRFTMVGLLFTSISMAINAAQRGAGNTRISMTTNMTANLVNCAFNALLINGLFFFPKLGVTGAAIATLMGNITACVMSIYSVSHKDRFLNLRITSLFHFDRVNLGLIGRIASSAAVEQVFMRFGFFMTAKLVADLGTIDFATHTICMNICTLSFCFGDGLGVAASALVGQNLGKKRPDLSIVYGKSAQRIGLLLGICLFMLFTLGGGVMMQLFMTEEAEAEQIMYFGRICLTILAFIAPAQISQVIYSGGVRGAGDTKFAAYSSLISIAVLRPIFTYLLCYVFDLGVVGAWFAIMVDQYTRLILMFFRFSGGKWAKIKV